MFITRVDVPLALVCAAIAVQLIPLPVMARAWVSPNSVRVQTLLSLAGTPAGTGPLSLDPGATSRALLMGLALLLVFWSTREVLRAGGVRRLVRSIVWLGLAAALIAVVQRAVSPLLIYGVWEPLDRGARPFGPFVNRNHLVAWMLMAIPLSGGYALARSGVSAAADRAGARRGSAISVTVAWLIAGSIIMTAAIFISLSRSGIVALCAMGAAAWGFARGRLERRHAWWFAAVVLAAVLAVASFTNVPALLARLDGMMGAVSGTDRRVIWRDTFGVIRDFWLTGTGLGTYQVAMLVYQVTKRQDVFFNQAHNQFLQFAAEGGVLLAIPASAAVAAFVSNARARLADASGLYWIRAAALAGMTAVAVQGLWETVLTMPANGVLFAVLAAIAVHARADGER